MSNIEDPIDDELKRERQLHAAELAKIQVSQ